MSKHSARCVRKRQNQSGTKTFRIHLDSGTISSSVILVVMFMSWMLTKFEKKGLIVEQFQGNYLKLKKLDALLRAPRQSLYWEALAILQLS